MTSLLKNWMVAGAVCLLAGCTTVGEKYFTTARPATAAERQVVVSYIRNSFFDPYSIRDAEISEVFTDELGVRGICVNMNAKNRLGAYTGRTYTLIYIQPNGTVRGGPGQFTDVMCTTPSARYSPFHEVG